MQDLVIGCVCFIQARLEVPICALIGLSDQQAGRRERQEAR